ncbi:hypothetical protein BsWGS_25146 [Bradybaena similaris]
MNEDARRKALSTKWNLFLESNTTDYLLSFAREFVDVYSQYFDPDFQTLSEGLYNVSPHVSEHPDDLLERLGQFMQEKSKAVVTSTSVADLEGAATIVKCLVIICRNYDNVSLVAAGHFANHTVACAQSVITKLYSQTGVPCDPVYSNAIISFIKHVLHFLECLYDPYSVWRKRLKGWTVDVEQLLSKPAPVHNEVIPFFHECFQKSSLSGELQLCLLHMFGAVMSGSLVNATFTVTPATLDVLLGVLSGKAACSSSTSPALRSEIQKIILQSIVGMIHTIHSCSPDQRQVEVPDVMSSYMQVLSCLKSDEQNYELLVSMIETISKMTVCNDRLAIQTLLSCDAVMEGLVSVIKKSSLRGPQIQVLCKVVLKSLQALLSGSRHSKDVFEKCVGYTEFLAVLQACGQPTKELLESLLDWVVEAKHESTPCPVIRNASAAVILMKWISSIESPDLQIWLSTEMKRLCMYSYANRMACCKGGMVTVLLDLLSQHSKLQLRAVGQIISLLERLGSFSITAAELKQLIGLLKTDHGGKQFPYSTRLMRAISTMARRDGICGPLHFFDIQQMSDVINLPGIRKWPGTAFSFFTLVCIDTESNLEADVNIGSASAPYRRLLYSFSSNNGCGFEAFITADYSLAVATFSKKEFSTTTVSDTTLDDGRWHSVGVVHVAGRRFSSSPGHVYVYIDGKLKTNVTLKFPSLTEPITSCRVGSPGSRAYSSVVSDNPGEGHAEPRKISPLKSFFGFANRGTEASSCGPGVFTMEPGNQEEIWGPTVCLYGQLELICVFHDVLQPEQVKALSQLGLNSLFHFSEDAVLADLPAKLVARYSAKAFRDHVCTDISPLQNHGTFTGNCCVNWDIKDVINCLGGLQVLFPILETLDHSCQLLDAETPSSPSKLEAEDLDLDDWTLVNNNSLSSPELKLDHNPLAAFITMIRYMLKEKPVNKDTFVRSYCAATLGMLMQKMPGDLMDINVLMSIQYLVEECDSRDPSCPSTKSTLLQHIYHYILFDFSLWNRTQFAVRIGHIQYLSTIIKDDRKYFRKKYGVQFLLDVIRAYYITTEVSSLTEEDSKTIRVSLLNLIKYYISSNIHADELNQIMAFILAVREPNLLLEAMDLLIALVESHSRKQHQLIVLLYEPEQAEMLYQLLTYPAQPIIFYEKVVKIIYLLLKSERISEKSKSRLRLAEIGHWGLINLMTSYDISAPMIKRFLEQVSITETQQTYAAILAILGIVHNSGLDIKSVAIRQLLAVIVSKTGAARGFAKQLGWQESITRLLTVERRRPFPSGSQTSTISNDSSNREAGSKPGLNTSFLSADSQLVQLQNDTQATFSTNPEASSSLSAHPSLIPEQNRMILVPTGTAASVDDTSSVILTTNSEENFSSNGSSVILSSSSPPLVTLDIPDTHSKLTSVPLSFSENFNTSAIPEELHGSQQRPHELNLHSSHVGREPHPDTSSIQTIDQLLATEPTPATPMYIKRTFYELGTSEDEEAGFLHGSRSSTASMEDLLQDTPSFSDSHSGVVSASASNVSLCSSIFEEDSALGNSQLSVDTLEVTTPCDSLGELRRLDKIRKQSSADNAFETEEDGRRTSVVLRGDGFRQVLDNIGFELSDSLEQKEELCQHVLIILLSIMWKGVEGSNIDSWKERCQVFTWIDELGESHVLIRPAEEIKRRLMEMLLHSCSTDIRSLTVPSIVSQSENAIELIRLVQGFVTEPEAPADRFSIRLLEDVTSLLDALGVWDTEAAVAWSEMVHRGFSVLLSFSNQPDLNLVSAATVKLHSLVQTKLISSSAEASYILGALNSMIVQAIEANTDNYAYLMPVLKALIDKGQELLTISTQLPHLPKTSMSSTFFDDFKTYAYSEEWQTFISNYVGPQMTHFMESNFEEGVLSLSVFWADCHEEMMMNHHRLNREIGESRLRFKKQVVEVYNKKVDHENRRYQSAMTQQKNQHLFTLRHWRATKRFFTGERGAWANREEQVYWKLSNQENFARMKVRLTQNYNFDDHVNASRLRDNIGVTDEDNSLRLTELKGVKDALVSQENIADDSLGDEEWSAISASSSNLEEYTGTEKLVISADCELITIVNEVKGRLEVTTSHVYFFDCSPHRDEAGEDFKWALSRLREIHFRRYNLRRSALEIFLVDQTNFFINFPEKGMRNKIYSHILSLRPVNLIYKGQRSPADLLRASGLTLKWVNREISNFEYLMQLNTIAGRTYNDLSQYHVFPWILMDYTSTQLDLDNPSVFRDLSKPVGIVNPRNEQEVRDKFDTFEDPSGMIEKFHYGTHYSNAASVMHYLVRVEPFTTLHIQLQSGKFDVADRQFHSIPGSFASLMDNPNDVKELIPEFFYFPEFLVNFNGFDLGKLQITKEQVNDVKLPPWSSTPEEFIYKHRQALESEYVSMNLHKWIDLIFGYKQKGPAAVEALNVFYYVTYEGAVDLDAIQDAKERASVEGMIRNFGQTPSQLLKEPHPKRMTFEEAVARNAKAGKPMNVFYFAHDLKPFFVEVSNDRDPLVYVCVPKSQSRSILQQSMPDSMITVTEDGVVGVHGWLPFDKAVPNFYTFDKDSSMLNPKSRKRLGGPFSPGLKITAKLFVVSHDAKLLFSGGYWDNSLQVYSLGRAKMINHIVRHIDVVTCLAIDNCGRHLVTGSRDTTCMVWEITQQAGISVNLNTKPLQTLYGHDSEVTAVHISTELDLVISASKDGTVILHTVLKGLYTMTLRAPSRQGWTLDIPNMTVSDTGQIVLYCVEMERQTGEGRKRQQERHSLHLYSVNGKHLFSQPLEHRLNDMCMSGDHLVLGNSSGQLIVMETFGLRPITTMELVVPIQCLAMSNINSHILVGLKDGKLIIVGRKGK